MACLRLLPPPSAFPLDRLRALVRRAQAAGIAVLIEDELDLALKLNADGLHANMAELPIAELRRALGPERSLGATADLSRHAALELAEAGADYVSFDGEGDDDALIEIVGWWAEVMTPPVVAEGFGSREAAVELARLGADFLALPVELPQDPRDHSALREIWLALGDIEAET